jgi:RHH-type transcriptional regulator, proline utilization regulon repressor / proline dehydrogenase / delta 1-pyrroline-5-carboxylate dehydrogenase
MSKDKLAQLRTTIRQNAHADEEVCVTSLLQQTPLDPQARERIRANALRWVELCRAEPEKQGLLDAFLQEYSLSSQEGVALMCLAEALLRVPDRGTANRLIAEKIHGAEWTSHRGHSEKMFVNAATWGLILTGKIVRLDDSVTKNPSHWLRDLVGRIGEPAVHFGVLQAMKLMGQQYVLGRTIDEAISRGCEENREGTRFSFDMLGEGARTYHDAEKYFDAYMSAIREIGQRNTHSNVYDADGISVKLSALHPRYHFSQRQRVLDEMLPRVLALATAAKRYNIGFTIDAEEAARLDLSLDVFQELAQSAKLADWNGLGMVLQAYQKRALPLIDWLAELAVTSKRRLMIRLVKGAYWDSEIKHAQEMGLADYPVFTRKAHTDLSYQVCASRLLALREHIHPQFATHNAYTIAMVLELLGGDTSAMEFQRLHGMGALLHDKLTEELGEPLPLRVYAPVGTHRDLLPYLVRRLLENGANSSFVNQFLSKRVPSSEITRSPEKEIQRLEGFRHSKIPLPRDIYRASADLRDNARGMDLDDPLVVTGLEAAVARARQTRWRAAPIIGGIIIDNGAAQPQYSPADLSLAVGYYESATLADIDKALTLAGRAQPEWQNLDAAQRALILERAGDELERETEILTGLISLEAGRTLKDGISEVREAVDFCRYYANQIRALAELGNTKLLQGRGIFVCISPWNFPLAIFIGQVTAALATGNSVIAKAAEQTSLVASAAVHILHRAGVPGDVLHLLTGIGSEIGPRLMSDRRVAGVAFTGSTDTARRIQTDLVKRSGLMPALIAETGGQNAMLVDSTALPEQVVDDVINSAFLSAGQRCSALRILFLQEDVADPIINMLKGALSALRIGVPWKLDSDLGPVIDAKARNQLLEHIARMDREASFIGRAELPTGSPHGHYIAPHIYELPNISLLEREVFGPVLHIIRYRAADLDQVINEINNTGYGLTLGIHSRIQSFAEEVFARTRVGNTYVNRNMVGAVVGVNPFGGQGLSGTGFKAGGPHYLLRFTNLWPGSPIGADGANANGEDAEGENKAGKMGAPGANIDQLLQETVTPQWHWNRLGGTGRADILDKAFSSKALASLNKELIDAGLKSLIGDKVIKQCQALLDEARAGFDAGLPLPGPTGEINTLSLHGRGVFLVFTDPAAPTAALQHTIAALAAGNAVLIADTGHQIAIAIAGWLQDVLPEKLLSVVSGRGSIEYLLQHNKLAGVAARNGESIIGQLSRRPGAIIPLVTHLNGPFALLPYSVEKTWTNNIVATGGNALLLNLQE